MRKFVSKKAHEIIIREPELTDVQKILKFFNKLIEEDTFILRFGQDKVTLEEEKDWLAKSLKKTKHKEAALLEAYTGNQLVGQVEVRKGQFRKRFMATLHLGVDRDFRGEGIGENLMREIELAAKKIGIKVIELQVFGENSPAIKLYEKLGYEEFGRIPKAIEFRGKMLDEVYMYKRISN